MLLGVDPGWCDQPAADKYRRRRGARIRPEPVQDGRRRQQSRAVPRGGHRQLGGRGVAAADARLHPPQVRLFSGQVDTGCGPATSDVGPFYCPVDKTAYFDTDFFQVLVDQFGSSGGPFAQEYVVAHEYGHHVQDLQGVLGRSPAGGAGRDGQRRAHRITGRLLRGDLGALRVDRQAGEHGCAVPATIERQGHSGRVVGGGVGRRRPHPEEANGRVNPESWTHGSSEQRQKWFTTGYQTGDPNKCDTFATNDLG